MGDETKPTDNIFDPVLAAMERKRAFHLEAADKLARDIAERKRVNAEYLGDAAPNNLTSVEQLQSLYATEAKPVAPEPVNDATQKPPRHVRKYEPFDGTLGSLIRHYRSIGGSPYFQLTFKVRKNYDMALNRLMTELGSEKIIALTPDRLQRKYEEWKSSGAVTARMLVLKIKMLAGFGAKHLKDDACIRLSFIIGEMDVEVPQTRRERLDASQVIAIRTKAHELGRSSLALAQALQFELGLQQVDVIGEWVPLSEPGESEIVFDDEKWLRGLRWSDIDANLVLHLRQRSRGIKETEFDLKAYPMIKEELALINASSRSGPLIICEWDGRPWKASEFRRWWRKAANEAGVPKNVWNMDTTRDDDDDGNRPSSRATEGYLQ